MPAKGIRYVPSAQQRTSVNSKRFLSAVVVLFLAAGAHAETLTILHTNDLHSRVEPINKYDSNCSAKDDAAGKCFGGYARLATAIRTARADAPNALLVDAGDQFQGSLFYTRYKGKVAAEMMNTLGYDAMTVGNHEFDDGPEVLRGFMDAVRFPVLMSNADVTSEPALADVMMPSTVIRRGGYRYGLIGLTPVDTPEISLPGPKIRFTEPAGAVRREIERFAGQGIDRIIVLSHSGYQVDRRIAAMVGGIDVIVGGHTNTFLSNTSDRAIGPYPTWVTGPDGGRTAIVQAYAYGKYLGRLDVSFDDHGAISEAAGEPLLMDRTVPEDNALKARIAALAAPLVEIRNRVIAEASAPIDGRPEHCRSRECEIGNLVADALLAHMKKSGAEIAITNGGGLRASIDQGRITMGEVLTVLPFQNLLSRFKLAGADIVATLEAGVSRIEEGKGRFPQVAGLRYSYTLSRAPGEGRILEVEVMQDGQWVPIDPGRIYSVVSNNFLRGGGDGYEIFARNAMDAYDFGPDMADVVAEYLAARSPYTPKLEGRITVK